MQAHTLYIYCDRKMDSQDKQQNNVNILVLYDRALHLFGIIMPLLHSQSIGQLGSSYYISESPPYIKCINNCHCCFDHVANGVRILFSIAL